MVNRLQKRNPSTERVLTDGSDTDTMQPKKERRRLSGIFGRKKDKTSDPQSTNASSDVLACSSTTATNPSGELLAPITNTTTNNDSGNSSNTVPTVASPMSGPVHDSAYASSGAPSNSRSENSNNIIPVQNEGQIEGVNRDRNLAVNKSTGDVLDEDTGEVVSTVTTTTTTTTTTTIVRGKDGKKEFKTNVNTVPAGSTITAASSAAATPRRSGSRPREASVVSEMPADPAPVRSSLDVPPALASSTSATRANTPPAPTPLQTSNTSLPPNAPDLPTKSPRRLSRESDRPPIETVEPVPSSPVTGSNFGANFSGRSTAPSPAPALPENAPPAPPLAQQTLRRSPSGAFKAWSQNEQRNSNEPFAHRNEALHGTPAPFPPPPRAPIAQSYPKGPEDYPSYTTSSAGPGNAAHFSPSAASFSHAGNNSHDHYGYPSGPPSSYGGLSTIESMSEESSIAPSASASQAPSAAPSATTSTLGSLKAAAKGIHGVGETLRGTLNNEIDTRFPRKNAEKAAIANAKNQAALERGRGEMAGLQAYENVSRTSGSSTGRWGLRREHSIPRKPLP